MIHLCSGRRWPLSAPTRGRRSSRQWCDCVTVAATGNDGLHQVIRRQGAALDHLVSSVGIQERIRTADVSGYCTLAGCPYLSGSMLIAESSSGSRPGPVKARDVGE